ncbi:MAG: hypothetical protein KZQ73_01105 [Candidatus Thiodiazotropha sp. (ex Semelilucina semeliformis)]|nr:hypothetical protein [Candidatus Thiodiazotropha sp. (ex Semelilucina semeliformis)]
MRSHLPGMAIRPGSSRLLILFLTAIHVLALTGLLIAPLTATTRLLLLSAVALHAGYSYRRFIRRHQKRITQARLESDGTAYLMMENGTKKRGTLRADSLVTPWVLILRFNLKRQFRMENFVIWQDMLSATELRQLRVLLRFSSTD